MSSAQTISRHDAGVRKAGEAVGGRFKSVEQTAAHGEGLLLPSDISPSPVTDEGQLAAETLAAARITGVTVVEADVFSRENPSENVVLGTGSGPVVAIGDVLAAPLDREDVQYGIEARAQYALDLERVERLRQNRGTLSPELDAMRDQEIRDLTQRTADFERGEWAPGHALIGTDEHILSDELDLTRGGYRARVRSGEGWDDGYVVMQTLADVPLNVDRDTASEYRREIEDWLSTRFNAEVQLDPDSRTFDAERTVGPFTDAPTEGRCVEEIEKHVGGELLHSFGTRDRNSKIPMDQMLEHLERTEIIDQIAFVQQRQVWEHAVETGLVEQVIYETGGPDAMSPEAWAGVLSAAGSGYQNDGARATYRARLEAELHDPSHASGNNPPLAAEKSFTDFVYHGRVTDRSLLARYLRAAAADRGSGFTHDFQYVAGLLADRLERGALIRRPKPRVSD